MLQSGLGLGVPYSVPGYPSGSNSATSLPWAPETDGLRNITGIVHKDGSATIYAITSTVSGNGDQGADTGFGEVLRGVSWTPEDDHDL